MSDEQQRYVAKLTPPGGGVAALLARGLGLDVWEVQEAEGCVIVAADESLLREIERRRLAEVERLGTVGEYVARRKDAV